MVTNNEKDLQLINLMQLALQGNQVAYGEFLTHISQYLRRSLAKRVPACDIEDVLQEILISIHKARHTHDGVRPILPWVSAIAKYRLTDYFRQHYRKNQHIHIDISEVEDFLSADVTGGDNANEYINEAVEQLPGKQQKILHLLHTEGYTAKEAGLKLGMKESAVKVAAHRAYKVIRAKLANNA